VQHEKPSFLATKPAISTPLARVNGKIIRRHKNSVFEVDLSIVSKIANQNSSLMAFVNTSRRYTLSPRGALQ